MSNSSSPEYLQCAPPPSLSPKIKVVESFEFTHTYMYVNFNPGTVSLASQGRLANSIRHFHFPDNMASNI